MTQPEVTASGDRSVALGDSAMHTIISTGDRASFFVGDYQPLAQAYQAPGSFFARLHLDEFSGREQTIGSIDSFIAEQPSGIVIVEAAAGMGKTTLLAWLVQHRDWYHHFPQLFAGRRDPSVAIRNLAAQLIRAWDLGSVEVAGLPPTASDPYYLSQLLSRCAEVRDATDPGKRIVLVVDALDEMEAPPGMNPAGLPEYLPDGVHVVAAQRPNARLVTIHPRATVTLEAQSESNATDLREFIQQFGVTRAGVAQALATHDVEPTHFVDALLEQSEGVWVYVQSVLDGVEHGHEAPDLSTLPAGLWDHYAREWEKWERSSEGDWLGLVMPALTTLAVAREPLTPTMLADFAGVADVHAVESLMRGTHSSDLDVHAVIRATGDAYSFHHATWSDFIHGANVRPQEPHGNRMLADSMARKARDIHSRIVDRHIRAWGGVAAGLPGLADPNLAMYDDGYGLRNVVAHLIAADRATEAHELLWLTSQRDDTAASVWRTAQQQYGSLDWYLSDIALCMGEAQDGAAAVDASTDWDLLVGYALLASGVRSMAGNLPSGLLRHQVDNGELSIERALSYVRAMPDPLRRITSLLALREAPDAPPAAELLREALTAVARLDDEQLKAGGVALLAPLLGEPHLGVLLKVANSIKDPYWRKGASEAATVLSSSREPPAWSDRDPGDESWHDPRLALTHAIAAGQLIDAEEQEAARRLAAVTEVDLERGADSTAEITTNLPPNRWRATALCSLLDAASDSHGQLATAAWTAATSVEDGPGLDRVLASAAAQLDAAGRHDFSVQTVKAIDNRVEQALGYVGLAARGPDRADVVRGALRHCLQQLPSVDLRTSVLATWQATGSMAQSEPLLGELGNVYWQAWVATSGEPPDDPAERACLSALVRESVGQLDSDLERAALLARWGAVMTEQDLDDAWDLARALPDGLPRSHAMAHLICVRGRLGAWRQALTDTSQVADVYWRDWCRYQLCLDAPRAEAQRAVDTARGIVFSHRRAAALIAIGERRGTKEAQVVVDELITRSGSDEAHVAAMLHAAPLAGPTLREVLMRHAVECADSLADPPEKKRATTRCAATLASMGKSHHALSLALSIDDEYWQATALELVVPVLALGDLEEASRAARSMVNRSARGRALVVVARRVLEMGHDEGRAAVATLLSAFADLPREYVLQALPAMLPVLADDPQSLQGCVQRIQTLRVWVS